MELAIDAYRIARRARLVAWVLAITALCLTSQALAEVTQQQLAQIVKKAIQDESVLYDPPRVSENNRVLRYSAGRILYPDYSQKPTQPLGFPIEVQFRSELIRKFRAKQQGELAFLKPYLAKLDKLVADELALIEKHQGTREELLTALARQDVAARKVLKEGVQNWAKKQGMTLAEESFQAAVIPTVKINTVPAGGTVYYLNAVDYNVYKAAGSLDQLDRWNQVPGAQLDMGGVFYFRATWPGGKTKQTAKILIDKEQTISLQAD